MNTLLTLTAKPLLVKQVYEYYANTHDKATHAAKLNAHDEVGVLTSCYAHGEAKLGRVL